MPVLSVLCYVYTRIMAMRILVLLAGILLLAVACQRDYPEGHPSKTARATHLWDIVAQSKPVPEGGMQPPEPEIPQDEVSQRELERGPAFSEEDTIDTAYLPGAWLQLCESSGERIEPIPVDMMDVIEFAEDGRLVYHLINRGEDNPQQGTWAKVGPGTMEFTVADSEASLFRMQMMGENLFFFWNYEAQMGFWFGKLTQGVPQQIPYSRYDSNFGEMHFESVNQGQFMGTIAGQYERTMFGAYIAGILLMRWEEPDTSAAGYGAMIMSPDGTSMEGGWWIDDYEAAPFGGPLTATAQEAATPPAQAQ